jgi:hypothetical protein
MNPYDDDYLNYVARNQPKDIHKDVNIMVTFMSATFILMVLGTWKLVELVFWIITKFVNAR